MRQVRGTGEVYKEFWWGNLREIHHWEYLVVDGTILLNWIVRSRTGARTELIALRIGTRSGLL